MASLNIVNTTVNYGELIQFTGQASPGPFRVFARHLSDDRSQGEVIFGSHTKPNGTFKDQFTAYTIGHFYIWLVDVNGNESPDYIISVLPIGTSGDQQQSTLITPITSITPELLLIGLGVVMAVVLVAVLR